MICFTTYMPVCVLHDIFYYNQLQPAIANQKGVNPRISAPPVTNAAGLRRQGLQALYSLMLTACYS